MRWFVKKFGKREHDRRYPASNSIAVCAVMGLLSMVMVFGFGLKALAALDATLEPESFVLQSAELHHVKRRGHDRNELRLISETGAEYVVEDDNIQTYEIEVILGVLEPGMQIDVQLARDGVREIVADGEVLLDRETTFERARMSGILWGAITAFMVFIGVQLVLRAIALHIKKRKGWNF